MDSYLLPTTVLYLLQLWPFNGLYDHLEMVKILAVQAQGLCDTCIPRNIDVKRHT